MKREILFRVWDIVEKCYLPEDVYCILNTTEFRAFGQMIKDWRDYKEGEYFYDDSQILEQFTGLTDKNGVKIFEDSDLVEVKFTIACDSFKECSYIQRNEDGSTTYKKILTLPSILTIRNPVTGYEFYNIEHDVYTPLWAKLEADVRCLEIIGNIHDNPELLK